MDIVTNHTADVIQLEGNAGYRNKTDYPYLDVRRRSVRRLGLRLFRTGSLHLPRGRPDQLPLHTHPSAGDETVKNPDWLNDPLFYHNRGDTELHRRELPLRRLLRPRRSCGPNAKR